MPKNPNWTRDELILALDLYFSIESGEVHANHPKVVKLSDLLNLLPIHSFRPDSLKFRNPNGVALKLNNFKSIDPAYHGKGMDRIGKLDKIVFDDFRSNRDALAAVASRIREVAADSSLREDLKWITDEPTDPNSAKEGKVLQRLHKYRERNGNLARIKKDKTLAQRGCLACEVCNFDFSATYGDLGDGYIECHHTTPLSELSKETKTTINDLALVCANCHRMLHRFSNLTLDELRSALRP